VEKQEGGIPKRKGGPSFTGFWEKIKREEKKTGGTGFRGET